jgi:hypothetical protein
MGAQVAESLRKETNFTQDLLLKTSETSHLFSEKTISTKVFALARSIWPKTPPSKSIDVHI